MVPAALLLLIDQVYTFVPGGSAARASVGAHSPLQPAASDALGRRPACRVHMSTARPEPEEEAEPPSGGGDASGTSPADTGSVSAMRPDEWSALSTR